MKVTIVQEYLIFHDTENEQVNELLKDLGLKRFIKKDKLHVTGTKEELYHVLYELTQDNDIDLI